MRVIISTQCMAQEPTSSKNLFVLLTDVQISYVADGDRAQLIVGQEGVHEDIHKYLISKECLSLECFANLCDEGKEVCPKIVANTSNRDDETQNALCKQA